MKFPVNSTNATKSSSVPRGILLTVIAVLIIPVMDGIAKELGGRYPTVQVVWARYFFHLILMLPLVIYVHGGRSIREVNFWRQSLRGILLMTSTWLFFGAIVSMPLADALALVFGYPLVVTAFSPWVLGESVGIRRWIAVSVGFLGVLIIVRPGFNELHIGYVLALLASIVFAGYVLLTRKLAGRAPALVALVYVALVGAVVTSTIVPFNWVPPSSTDWMLMAALGVVAATGHGLLILSYEYAGAAELAPFGYLEIVTATLIGYVFFDEFPEPLTWLGVGIVIAAGAYIAVREARQRP